MDFIFFFFFFFFFLRFIEVWRQWVPCKVNVTPFRASYILHGTSCVHASNNLEKWNLFLKYNASWKYCYKVCLFQLLLQGGSVRFFSVYGIWAFLLFYLWHTCLFIVWFITYECPFFSKWAVTWQKQQNECAPSEDSDQPGRPPSMIKVFAVRMKNDWLPIKRTAKILIRLSGCLGWSESSLGAHSFYWVCHVAAQCIFSFMRIPLTGSLREIQQQQQ